MKITKSIVASNCIAEREKFLIVSISLWWRLIWLREKSFHEENDTTVFRLSGRSFSLLSFLSSVEWCCVSIIEEQIDFQPSLFIKYKQQQSSGPKRSQKNSLFLLLYRNKLISYISERRRKRKERKILYFSKHEIRFQSKFVAAATLVKME